MIEYVCGLLFNDDLTKVLLIRKNKPEWLLGKLNGIGGKVEAEEHPWTAIVREFKEEAGVKTSVKDWINFAVLNGKDPTRQEFKVHWFAARSYDIMSYAYSAEEEVVGVYPVADLARDAHKTPANLNWLIIMAIEALNGKDDCVYYELNEKHWKDGVR